VAVAYGDQGVGEIGGTLPSEANRRAQPIAIVEGVR
jgi:hypothetical protein